MWFEFLLKRSRSVLRDLAEDWCINGAKPEDEKFLVEEASNIYELACHVVKKISSERERSFLNSMNACIDACDKLPSCENADWADKFLRQKIVAENMEIKQ